jgi:hypothetical protein
VDQDAERLGDAVEDEGLPVPRIGEALVFRELTQHVMRGPAAASWFGGCEVGARIQAASEPWRHFDGERDALTM